MENTWHLFIGPIKSGVSLQSALNFHYSRAKIRLGIACRYAKHTAAVLARLKQIVQ